MTEFQIDITLSEVEMTLHFTAELYIAPTWGYSGGDPGQPAHHYPDTLIEYGVEIPWHRLDRMLVHYQEEIDQAIIHHLDTFQEQEPDDYY